MSSSSHQRERGIALLMSMVVGAICFGLGVWWVAAQYNRIELAMVQETGREIRGRMMVFRQMVGMDKAAFDTAHVKALLSHAVKPDTQMPDGLDVFALYDGDRKYMVGARRLIKDQRIVNLPSDVARTWLPGDTTLFDQAADGAPVSGFLVIDGRPLVMTVRHLGSRPDVFVLMGRWLDARKLVASAAMSQGDIEVYVPSDQASLPADVQSARESMGGETLDVFRAEKRGRGIGYLRFDDVNERTAFIVRYVWSSENAASERRSLWWLFSGCLTVAGIVYCGFILVINYMERLRRRVRGFNGMAEHDVRELVESFPGFALAVNRRLQYVGVSRVLSGLTGKEPAEFAGKSFGTVCHEDKADMETLLIELGNQDRWPRMSNIEFAVQGLTRRMAFQGVAHYVKGPEVVLVILSEQKEEVVIDTVSGMGTLSEASDGESVA